MKRRCCNCQKLTDKWQKINGSSYHCYDGCFSTTGYDYRDAREGLPIWLSEENKEKVRRSNNRREAVRLIKIAELKI